jgi:site-specific recombinase XerD
MGIDIYGYEERFKRTIERIRLSGISDTNKDLILRFCDSCLSEGLSTARVWRYALYLKQLAEWLRIDFDTAGKEDILSLVRFIEKKDYAAWTKAGYRITLKKFYKWLNGGEEYPDKVRWIKTTTKNCEKLPEELLTEEEVKRLVDAALNPRDKAFIFVLYESGCRISEVATLRIKNVRFDEIGAQIIVKGKTGMRRVRLIASAPLLAYWIDNHPRRHDPDSPLWVGIKPSTQNSPLKYPSIKTMLKKAAERAGIKKRIYPHLFRHSRATHLAKHLTEAQMKQYFGWVQGSDMASTYVHLSGRDVDDALLKIYGIKEGKSKKDALLQPARCPRCHKNNPPTSKFCNCCGAALDIKTAIETDNRRAMPDRLMNALIKDPEVRRLLVSKIAKMEIWK